MEIFNALNDNLAIVYTRVPNELVSLSRYTHADTSEQLKELSKIEETHEQLRGLNIDER